MIKFPKSLLINESSKINNQEILKDNIQLMIYELENLKESNFNNFLLEIYPFQTVI